MATVVDPFLAEDFDVEAFVRAVVRQVRLRSLLLLLLPRALPRDAARR